MNRRKNKEDHEISGNWASQKCLEIEQLYCEYLEVSVHLGSCGFHLTSGTTSSCKLQLHSAKMAIILVSQDTSKENKMFLSQQFPEDYVTTCLKSSRIF